MVTQMTNNIFRYWWLRLSLMFKQDGVVRPLMSNDARSALMGTPHRDRHLYMSPFAKYRMQLLAGVTPDPYVKTTADVVHTVDHRMTSFLRSLLPMFIIRWHEAYQNKKRKERYHKEYNWEATMVEAMFSPKPMTTWRKLKMKKNRFHWKFWKNKPVPSHYTESRIDQLDKAKYDPKRKEHKDWLDGHDVYESLKTLGVYPINEEHEDRSGL